MATQPSRTRRRPAAAPRRRMRPLWLLCGLGLLVQGGPAKQKQNPEAGGIVRAVIGSIRQPKPGELPNPESPVRLLLEQVKRQDIDEAAKAFPIVERYRGVSFSVWAKRLHACDWARCPLPGAPYRNLILAMEYLRIHERLSLALLLDGVPDRMFPFEGKNPDKQIAALGKKLDRSRLRALQIKQIRVKTTRLPLRVDDEISKAMGIKERRIVEAKVECGGAKLRCSFFTAKIGGNWRIADVFELERSE